jgi:hypothetical protein
MNLVRSILGVCLAIVAILSLANLGWWLVMKAIGRLLESARDVIKQEHINKLQDLREQQQRKLREELASAKARGTTRRRFVTPAGKTVDLDILEQHSLRRNCLEELNLNPDANWSSIKKAWRRQALVCHPDRGGDQDVWLRKLRAYEALEQMYCQ